MPDSIPDSDTASAPPQPAPSPLSLPHLRTSLSEIKRTLTTHHFATLKLQAANITTIGILETYTHLTTISLPNNLISDISPIVKCANLQHLDLSGNKVKSVPRSLWERLITCEMARNEIDSWEEGSAAELCKLDLGQNNLSQFPKMVAPKLQILQLRENKLRDIPTVDAPGLKELYLTQNSITSMKKLEQFPQLKTLYLRQNPVEEIINIKGIKLNHLNLRGSKITLEQIDSLPSTNSITISETPLSEAPNHRVQLLTHLPAMVKIDKDEVTDEERGEAVVLRKEKEQRRQQENGTLSGAPEQSMEAEDGQEEEEGSDQGDDQDMEQDE